MGNESHIGRVKTVLVSEEGPAVITTIIATAIENKDMQKLKFTGSVVFSDSTKHHIEEIILPQIESITESLGVSQNAFELSVINVGAISSSDKGFPINGFSADISIFMALISAALNLPIEQNILFTGHIASKEGDIAQVNNLEAKSKASVADELISTFVYPNIDGDVSMKTLKPIVYENSKAAIRSCRGKIKLLDVNNTFEVVEKSIQEEAIVLSSLNHDFFENEIPKSQNKNHELISKYFLEKNKKRFWMALEFNILNKNVSESHTLIDDFVDYYLRKEKYPRNFGKELIQLVLSLPYSVQKTTGLFPLVKKNKYISLIQYSLDNDEEDISILHEALYGKTHKNKPTTENNQDSHEENIDATDRLDYILEQINPDYIDLNILNPIDQARASFILGNTISQSYKEFLDILNSFYMHILRKTNNYMHEINEERISIEANKIFEETFPNKVQQNEAISIARNGNKGGLRYIFDQITEYLKRELKAKHVSWIINDAVNPLDFGQKLELISRIMKREERNLDEEIKDLDPQQFVEYYKEIIIEYANSKQSLNRIFRIY